MVQPGRKATSPLAIERGARLAHTLRASREEHRWAQTRLAQIAGVGVETLRKIEGGRTCDPGFFTVVDLARALDLDLADLVSHLSRADPTNEERHG